MSKLFGEILRRLRKERGMSQNDVCKALGISQQRLSSWENNKVMPASDVLLDLMDLYEVDDILKEFGFHKEYDSIKPTKNELKLIYNYRKLPDKLADLHSRLINEELNNLVKIEEEKQPKNKFLIAASGAENATDEEIEEAIELAKNL